MTRVSENTISRVLLGAIGDNRELVNKFGEQMSSGYKVSSPGDSTFGGTIARYRELVARIEGHSQRINVVGGVLKHQDEALNQVADLLIRAKELAEQGSNETNDAVARAQIAEEVWALRDQLINLANSKYQGTYPFGGADNDDPPYDRATNYTVPASGDAIIRYQYDSTVAGVGEPAGALSTSVQVTDDVTVVMTKPGNQIFDNALYALERLGRSLAGYTTNPATGAPDGTGAAYTAAQYHQQTLDIAATIDLLETARARDILPERVDVGARLKRLENADDLLNLSKNDALNVLDNLQNADYATAATNLTQAQTALQASYKVTTDALNLNILQFI